MQKQPKREDFIEPKKKAFYSFAFFNDFSNRVVGDFLYVVERAWTEQKMGLIFMLREGTHYTDLHIIQSLHFSRSFKPELNLIHFFC